MSEPASEPTSERTTPSGPSSDAPALSAMSGPGRLVLGGAIVLLISAILGVAVGAWSIDQYGLILIVVALVAAGAAFLGESGAAAGYPVAAARMAAGAVGAALTLLALIEMLFDFDDLDDRGGIVGFALAVVAVLAALTVLLGAVQSDPETRERLRTGDQGTNIALAGAGLVLVAWILHLTIGFWAFGPAAWGITALVLAVVVLVFRDEIGTPFPAAWIAVVLGVVGAVIAVGQWSALMDIGATRVTLGPEDYLPFLIYVIGIVAILGGSLLVAMAGMRAAGGDAAPPPAAPQPPTGGAAA